MQSTWASLSLARTELFASPLRTHRSKKVITSIWSCRMLGKDTSMHGSLKGSLPVALRFTNRMRANPSIRRALQRKNNCRLPFPSRSSDSPANSQNAAGEFAPTSTAMASSIHSGAVPAPKGCTLRCGAANHTAANAAGIATIIWATTWNPPARTQTTSRSLADWRM